MFLIIPSGPLIVRFFVGFLSILPLLSLHSSNEYVDESFDFCSLSSTSISIAVTMDEPRLAKKEIKTMGTRVRSRGSLLKQLNGS